LVDDDPDEAVEGAQVLVLEEELFIVGQGRRGGLLDFEGLSQDGRKGSEVVPQEKEVDLIGNPSVMVKVNL
jgi:hypothetical protein